MRVTELSPETRAVVSRARDRMGLGCGLAAVVLWFYSVHRANFSLMSGYGLASVLDKAYFLGLILVIVGFTSELVRPELHPRRLIFLIVVLVVFIYGTGPAIEPLSAFP